jgi:hypothetical protein
MKKARSVFCEDPLSTYAVTPDIVAKLDQGITEHLLRHSKERRLNINGWLHTQVT